MTAVEHMGYRSPAGHPLAPGATPAVIREHLLDEDQARFDQALADAEDTGDPDTRAGCLEHWRVVAMSQLDHGAYARMVRRAAERATGEASPADEPLRVSRAKAGL